MFWIGPERDSSIHRGLDPVLAPLVQADYIVCTGLFDDETESAEDYRAMMLQARERQLTLICANPDIVVERGDRLIYCADQRQLARSEEHTSELQSHLNLVCRLLLEKKK